MPPTGLPPACPPLPCQVYGQLVSIDYNDNPYMARRSMYVNYLPDSGWSLFSFKTPDAPSCTVAGNSEPC